MAEKLPTIVKNTSLYIFLGLLAYMPLHILLSTWLGTSFGVLEFAKVAKDGVLVFGFLLTLAISVRQKWLKPLLHDKLVWLIAAYAALTVLLALFKSTDQDAEVLGVVYNTRFLLFFLYGALLARLFPVKRLQSLAVRTVLWTGVVVVLFGILQFFVLPNDTLTHVGYSRSNGVLPAFFIDDKPDLERVMSTVRDPNSLGSYLIIVITLLLGVFTYAKSRRQQQLFVVYILLAGLCLWLTFSRGALIGLIAAVGTFLALGDNWLRRAVVQHRNKIIAATVIGALVVLSGLFVARDTYLVQNIIFHADQSTVQEDPNELRIRFWQESVIAIGLVPEGTGPGTAGLASIRNDKQGTILNENYYLQIGTEVGLVGLALFLAILFVVGRRLYRLRASPFALAIFASFVGLALTNLLVHIWSNEAVAYTWWGLAALALAEQAPPRRAKRS